MKKSTVLSLNLPQSFGRDALTDILRKGAQRLLSQAIEAEIQSYIEETNFNAAETIAIRNGYLPERTIQTGIGPVPIKQPRARIKGSHKEVEKFTSKILPPYLKRAKTIEELFPALYLKGLSTGDFGEAFSSLLGQNASGLSASTITRLKSKWEQEFNEWNSRPLDSNRYVYIWVDGVYFNVRLEEDRLCVLVVIGATSDGTKEVLGIQAGYRESEVSWRSLLASLRDRGLTIEPELAVGDGALGFWAALDKVYPKTKRQRCWVHKIANVLDKLPKRKQPEAKRMLHEIYNSPTKKEANDAFDRFIEVFDDKYEAAVRCLKKDREALLSFYDFPAQHWRHIRTTNPIESMFATVRLRTTKTKGCGSSIATTVMVFKLAQSASKRWKKLRGSELLADVIDIRWKFVDGVKTEAMAA